jgi:predicted transcriptional regulator
MTKSENSPLSKNELEIVRLTIEGESQLSISKQLGLSPSAVCRTLQKPHIIEKIQSTTQELHYPIYQKMMSNYARAQERIGRELETMDINQVLKYLSHTKTLILKMVIETARVENKKREEANKEPEIIEVKYYDTDEYIDREARKLVKKWGYEEPPEGNFIRM